MTGRDSLAATRALGLFRARQLSPAELLLTAVIERAQAVEPAINAFAVAAARDERFLWLDVPERRPGL